MTNNISKLTISLIAGMLATVGCTESHDDNTAARPQTAEITVALRPAGFVRSGAADDSTTGTVTGYRFVGGVLAEALRGEAAGNDGLYTFRPSALEGEIRFVANDTEDIFGRYDASGVSEEEFLTTDAAIDALAADLLMMTGQMVLDAGNRPTTVTLRRSVARIDIEAADSDVEILEVSIYGLADRGYVFARQTAEGPATASSTDFSADYGNNPLSGGSETLLYACEQAGRHITAEVTARIGGGLHRMKAELPSNILRNKIYTLRVHGNGADMAVSVTDGDWENGSSTDAAPTLKGLVDAAASTLSDGVRVNSTCDTVFVDHRRNEFRLVLRAEAGAEVEIEGSVRGVTANVGSVSRSLEAVASVTVASEHRIPGEPRSYICLDIHNADLYSGRVVIVFEPNPTELTGFSLDADGVCDFGGYVDGELGRLRVPQGSSVSLEFDADEDPWLALAEEDGAVRILGGWRPNDPRADGRMQQGRIVITANDGSDTESYTLRRRNHGLPVVEIGGTWWCKYNLRGDARSFADQIQIADDPASADELADYLNGCGGDELLRLMGDQYQGGNPAGLPLRHDGALFYYEGMSSTAKDFGTLDPTSMAPAGYRLPDYDDYAFFSGSKNYNIGGVGSRTYRNMAGEEISVRIIERDIELLGADYGTVAFYEFSHDGKKWVLYGPGHQWNTTPGNISRMMIMLATCGSSGYSWLMEGYAQDEKANQNWLKFVAQNSTKTRTLRCVKSPVEYMY